MHPSLPAKDVKELIALAKARPGQITYASSGNGSGGHLCMELFKTMTGTNFVHVPYKGGGPALVDTLAGQVQVLFTPPVSATQHVQSGRLRSLAVSTVRRSSGMPDLPTIAESGVPGYDSGVWYGVLAPAGTPREIVMRVNGDVVKALQQPDFQEHHARRRHGNAEGDAAAELLALTNDDPETPEMSGTARPHIGHRDRVRLTLRLTRPCRRAQSAGMGGPTAG